MRIAVLDSIKSVSFSTAQAAEALGVSQASARIACHRYVQKKLLIRLKRDMYIPLHRWANLGEEDQFAIANRIQTPSYVSFTTALAHYEITTQIPLNYFESAALQRTKEVAVKGTVFRYSKIDKKLYFGFVKKRGFFIATPEKALLDALYMTSLHRYRLDLSAIDRSKLNACELKKLAKRFPAGTQRLFKSAWNT